MLGICLKTFLEVQEESVLEAHISAECLMNRMKLICREDEVSTGTLVQGSCR